MPSVNLIGKENEEAISKCSLPRRRAGIPGILQSSSKEVSTSSNQNMCIAEVSSDTQSSYTLVVDLEVRKFVS